MSNLIHLHYSFPAAPSDFDEVFGLVTDLSHHMGEEYVINEWRNPGDVSPDITDEFLERLKKQSTRFSGCVDLTLFSQDNFYQIYLKLDQSKNSLSVLNVSILDKTRFLAELYSKGVERLISILDFVDQRRPCRYMRVANEPLSSCKEIGIEKNNPLPIGHVCWLHYFAADAEVNHESLRKARWHSVLTNARGGTYYILTDIADIDNKEVYLRQYNAVLNDLVAEAPPTPDEGKRIIYYPETDTYEFEQ